MTSEQWDRIKEIFEAALERPAEARASFIAAACHGDAEMRAELDDLLEGHARAGNFLAKPIGSLTPAQDPAPAGVPVFAPKQVISGRFEIVGFLGRGGMGEVYAAQDLELGERVALKTIRHEISSDPQGLSRFKQEIQLARRVTHPNVCRIFDFGRYIPPGAESDSVAAITFLTMELLEGETLSLRMRRCGPITTAQALFLVEQMAMALAAAHDAGIIHRDFKPSNVMLVSSGEFEPPLEDCRAVVMDFGLARTAAQTNPSSIPAESLSHSLTATGQVLGTLAYMAPEQLEGSAVSRATDVYALGLVMYEMVTGKSAYPDDLPFVGVFKRVKEPPPPPCQHLPDLDPTWNSVILRCLEIDPAKRFQNAGDVIAALQGELVLNRAPAVDVNRSRLGIAAVVGIVIALAAAAYFHFPSRPRSGR
jgi:eukaryotic-like serine/threonine-protein kinase